MIKTTIIDGVVYQNAFGLLHRIKSEEEIAQLPPQQQYLERLSNDLAQNVQEEQEVDISIEWSEEDDCWAISVLDETILVEADSKEEAYEYAREDVDRAITRYEFTH